MYSVLTSFQTASTSSAWNKAYNTKKPASTSHFMLDSARVWNITTLTEKYLWTPTCWRARKVLMALQFLWSFSLDSTTFWGVSITANRTVGLGCCLSRLWSFRLDHYVNMLRAWHGRDTTMGYELNDCNN